MDFKSLISKIESIDGKINTPKAPELPKSVQLNEDAQLRVLSGRTTYVAEAKKKKDEEVKEADDMKVGDKKNIATGTVEKTKTGIVHKSSKAYGGSEEKEADDEDDKPKKKAKKESVEPEFKSKFMKMVEAKKDEAADKKKKMAKKEKMAEGGLPMTTVNGKKVPAFAADGKGKNDLGKGKDTEADDSEESGEKKDGKKGMSDKQAKFFGKKTESKMMPKDKKKTVKESVETKLSFKQMVQLVQESGGQQQIDAIDKALFTWAERVARNKLGEGMKADLYAGLVYERNGGVFEMYDVLSESKKKIVESRSRLDEGIKDMLAPYVKKAANALMSKLDPKTLQGLKQAHDQSGGDRNKFMAAIGITKQDLAPLAKDLRPVKEASDDTFAKAMFGSGTSLKSKVLTGVFNIVPMLGVSELLTGGAIGDALTAATGGNTAGIIFYLVSAALVWGVGHYDFGDMDRKGGSKPPVGFTSDGS